MWDVKGALVLAKPVSSRDFPGVEESVSNWVRWYKEPQPRISIESKGSAIALRVEGNSGVDRVFTFKDVQQ